MFCNGFTLRNNLIINVLIVANAADENYVGKLADKNMGTAKNAMSFVFSFNNPNISDIDFNLIYPVHSWS